MSRLDFGPKQKEVKINDIARGKGEFKPKRGRPVSLAGLSANLKKAGYVLESATIQVSGVVEQPGDGWALRDPASGQVFGLRVSGTWPHKSGEAVTITGLWTTEPGGETILVKSR